MPNLSGKHWNAVEDRIVKRARFLEDQLVASLLSDGEPYGTEIVSGRELYDQLIQMRSTGDPAYYSDPRAAETLAQLSELYGPPPAQVPPFSDPFTAGGM